MKLTQKKKKVYREFNTIVYARNRNTLWMYRNILYEIIDQTDYHIDVTLTENADTVLRVSEFIRGGVDLIIADTAIYEEDAMMKDKANINLPTVLIFRQGKFYHIRVYGDRAVPDEQAVSISDRHSLQELLEQLLFRISSYYD